ncbi:13336_t:CDS:2, partial [Entrophospora sp. SA101]
NYEHEISELKKNLDTSYNHIDGIQNLYEEQFSKNKYLLEQWNSHFSNQQKHIEAIKEITNADRGGYPHFQKWLESLSDREEHLPEGLLFDNEQKGQKNYLDHGFNTMVYHIVTSFVAFNIGPEIKIQHTQEPWLYNTLTHDQYKKLLSPSPQMQQEFDNELYHFLNEIIDQLKTEKMQSFNKIDDDLTRNMNSQNGFDKYCLSYNEKT